MIINEINKEELIDFDYVVDLIDEQFKAVMSTDVDFYSNFNFKIANEQYYVPDEDREPNKIFIVIKFLPAEVDYGQDVIPLTIQAVSESNGLAAVQRLLLEYAQIFNLNTLMRDGKTIYQSYTTPNVISNFDVVYDGFRSVFVMSGTVLISSNINRITLKYYDGDYALLNFPKEIEDIPATTYLGEDYVFFADVIYKWSNNRYEICDDFSSRIKANIGLNDEEVDVDIFETPSEKVYIWDKTKNKYVESDGDKIDILNYTDTFDASPDTQPYFKNNNFTDSIIKFGTFSFTISSFLTKNDLNNKILKIISRKKTVNNNFYFKISMDNGLNMPLLKFKFINMTREQNKGEMPAIVLAFTN